MVAPGQHGPLPHIAQLPQSGAAAPLWYTSRATLACSLHTIAYHSLNRAGAALHTARPCSEEAVVQPATYREIAWHFGILGWTAVSSWRPPRMLRVVNFARQQPLVVWHLSFLNART